MFKISNKKSFGSSMFGTVRWAGTQGKKNIRMHEGEQDISKLKDKDENGNTEVQNFWTDEALPVLIRMP
jgi:hypothetical protein